MRRIRSVDSLKHDLDDRKRKQAKLIEAIETAGEVSMLANRLRDLESEIKRIQGAIAAYRPLRVDVAVGEIRAHVTTAVLGLRESLTTGADLNNVLRAKNALARHVEKLILTPVTRDGRQVYKVTGNITLPPESEKCRMQVVARDGIEPPTPAFSGPPTDAANRLKNQRKQLIENELRDCGFRTM